jgi:hypothetical protein
VSAVIIDCNCKEVPINPVIKFRTHYYSSRKPPIRDSTMDDSHKTLHRVLKMYVILEAVSHLALRIHTYVYVRCLKLLSPT